MLEFRQITEYKKGIVFSLLSHSFAELLNPEFETKIRKFDSEAFENPTTIGACVLISTLDDIPVGLVSWDPRGWPDLGVIGYNCILPEYRRRGYGKIQIQEILRRFRQQGFKKAFVTTGEHPFFEPASKLYLVCGFNEIRKYSEGRDPRYGSIDYELDLN